MGPGAPCILSSAIQYFQLVPPLGKSPGDLGGIDGLAGFQPQAHFLVIEPDGRLFAQFRMIVEHVLDQNVLAPPPGGHHPVDLQTGKRSGRINRNGIFPVGSGRIPFPAARAGNFDAHQRLSENGPSRFEIPVVEANRLARSSRIRRTLPS